MSTVAVLAIEGENLQTEPSPESEGYFNLVFPNVFHATRSLHSRAMGSSSAERASFATTARLLSCLVTESLVRAIFVPLRWSDCVGIGVVLNAPIIAATTIPIHDVLAIVLLRHVPVLKTGSDSVSGDRDREPRSGGGGGGGNMKEIGLL